jgi:hypothetical protein
LKELDMLTDKSRVKSIAEIIAGSDLNLYI